MSQAEQFWRDGYLIARAVFTPEEVAAFRAAALERTERAADLLSHPVLRKALLNPGILAIYRELLGPELVYIGDSSTMIGPTAAGFHKDNVDKDDISGPDWKGRYTIVRAGIYTHDTARYPDGVDLRLGSHETTDLRFGKHIQPDARIGDVIFWNLRTSHSGGAMKVLGRPLNPESVPGKIFRRLPFLRDKAPGERVALFMSIAAPGPHLDRLIDYLKTREYAITRWAASEWGEDARLAAWRAKVELRDVAIEPHHVANAH